MMTSQLPNYVNVNGALSKLAFGCLLLHLFSFYIALNIKLQNCHLVPRESIFERLLRHNTRAIRADLDMMMYDVYVLDPSRFHFCCNLFGVEPILGLIFPA